MTAPFISVVTLFAGAGGARTLLANIFDVSCLRRMVIVWTMGLAAVSSWAQDVVVEIGSRRELFVDGALVDQLQGQAELRLHHPVPREVVMVFDRPWEGNATAYSFILKDGDRYRMYYRAWQLEVSPDGMKTGPNPMAVCYAESGDGINWRRPDLGLHEFQGTKQNNIMFVPGEIGGVKTVPGAPAVFKDDRPGVQADALYKTFVHYNRYGGGQLPLKSPDGIHWSLMSDVPAISDPNFNAFDSQNCAFWDTSRGEYRAYWRYYDPVAKARSIRTATSKDFLHWANRADVRYVDSPIEELYENFVAPYDRAPHLLIGLPVRYIERGWSDSMRALPDREIREWRAGRTPVPDLLAPDGREPGVTVALAHGRNAVTLHERYGTALTESLLMASRDGFTFKRWNEAFVPPGPERSGTWHYGHLYIAPNLVETRSALADAPNELSLYASENYGIKGGSALRRHTLRLDGFVSVQAPSSGGEVITKPVRFTGARLLLNFSTSAAGSLRVEIQDLNGKPLPGFALSDCPPIFGDTIERPVTWAQGQDVSALAGRAVRLRFELKDADLYAFQFIE